MSSYRSPLGDVLILESRAGGFGRWPRPGHCPAPGGPEIHLQVKGAGDRLMITDGVHHVADVAPQRRLEVRGWQPWGVGGGPGLPLQPPQDAVSPCGLAFLLTGRGRKRMGREGLAGEREGTPMSLLEPLTPGPISGHETPGPQPDTVCSGQEGAQRNQKVCWPSSDSAKDLQPGLHFYESNCHSETFPFQSFSEVWTWELDVSVTLASPSLKAQPQKSKGPHVGKLRLCLPSILFAPLFPRWRGGDLKGK